MQVLTVKPQSIKFYSTNQLCPLSAEAVLAQDINVDPVFCSIPVGEFSGVVVLNADGSLHLE